MPDLTARQKEALRILADKLESMGVGSDPEVAVAITPATPAIMEATVMITATVAGSCQVDDELQADREAVLNALGEITSLDDLQALCR